MTQRPAEIAHGPILIGMVFNILLYGIMIAQIYLYQTSNHRDRLLIRCFVYFLFFGDTIHTVFTIVYVYDSLIRHFGDVAYLATTTWVFATDPALTGILGSLVQAFFAWRIKVLTNSAILVTIILLCSLSSFFMGIATSVAVGLVPRFLEFQKFKSVVIVWLGSASFADIVITSTLVVYLRNHRTGFARTDNQIDRIIRLTMQTGLLTSVWAFVDLMVYLLDPTSGTHLIFNLPLSKLYTNALMSSLNARNGWHYDDDHNGDHPNSGARGGFSRRLSNVLRLDTEVFVHVESQEMADTRSAKPGDDQGKTSMKSSSKNSELNV